MKKIHTWSLKNIDFLHGVFTAIQWGCLVIVFALETDSVLKEDWMVSACILSSIGYLSIILLPIFIFQHKFIFREHSKKIIHGIIIMLFYSEILLIFHLIFTTVFSKTDPLFCFANTGAIFTFSCMEKILDKTNRDRKAE
jgi:hypothetical protein